MSTDTFIDTNVLAYAFDSDSPFKQATAQDLIKAGNFIISAQVLGELYVTLTRKLTRPVPTDVAKQAIDELCVLPVIATSASLVAAGVETSIRHQLSYWDALIIEAAVAAGCKTLITEDLADGSTIRGVDIVNPFH